MAKNRFGGDAYKPKQLGPEPALVPTKAPSPAPERPAAQATQPIVSSTVEGAPATPDAPISAAALKAVKVPYSNRIAYPADLQLKAMARKGRSQVDLLAEALNLLFKKYGLEEVA